MCGIANGVQSGGEGGVAWLGSLAGCVGLPEFGNAGLRAGTTLGWEMAARWSSENVVVEFRDSQVSRGPMEPSGHALSRFPSPTLPGPSRGWRGASCGRCSGDERGGDWELLDLMVRVGGGGTNTVLGLFTGVWRVGSAFWGRRRPGWETRCSLPEAGGRAS